MIKKAFEHLRLDKKWAKKLQITLLKFIKTVSFIIYNYVFFYYKLLNLNKINLLSQRK